MLVDTGGLVWDDDPLAQAVARQAEIAIDESDVTIFLTDAKPVLPGRP